MAAVPEESSAASESSSDGLSAEDAPGAEGEPSGARASGEEAGLLGPEGPPGCEGADALEAAGKAPVAPEALEEKVLGYWRLAFTSGADTFTAAGLSGCGAGESRRMIAHFQRFAREAPRVQTVELVGDADLGAIKVATLKGSYSAVEGLVREKGKGLLGRVLGRRSQYTHAPSIEEVYDALLCDGLVEPGPHYQRRMWACTFLGERLRVNREADGGLAVYDRVSEAEALREVERLAALPFGPEAMARQMLEQLQLDGMGSRIGDGRGDAWRRNGNGDGPIGQSSIP